MSTAIITEAMLDDLRAEIATVLGEFRMAHTLGVEEMAAELAALLGLTPAAARQRLHRARLKLRHILEEDGYEI